MISFFIPGEPVPKARMRIRLTRGRLWRQTPEQTVTWESYIRAFITQFAPSQLLDCPLEMSLTFKVTKPPSRRKKDLWPDRKPDLDNLVKSVKDACEGILYVNDSRVVIENCMKIYGDPPGVHVQIKEIDSEES